MCECACLFIYSDQIFRLTPIVNTNILIFEYKTTTFHLRVHANKEMLYIHM